jgi:hypothetical protein
MVAWSEHGIAITLAVTVKVHARIDQAIHDG